MPPIERKTSDQPVASAVDESGQKTPTKEDLDMINAAAKRNAELLSRTMSTRARPRPQNPAEAQLKKGDRVRGPDGEFVILDADEPMIKSTITKPFELMLDNHSRVKFPLGVYDVPLSLHTHWYAQANGIKPFDPKDLEAVTAAKGGVDMEALRASIRAEERQKLIDEQNAAKAKEAEADPAPADDGKPAKGKK